MNLFLRSFLIGAGVTYPESRLDLHVWIVEVNTRLGQVLTVAELHVWEVPLRSVWKVWHLDRPLPFVSVTLGRPLGFPGVL